ncbi:MerR family transcriptional regulator [Celeribacter marinus]|uniref:Transcriptional regulator, MerR family n=1 Tax=Celeribacter marinus TaxID=1397108 RepID=A0A0P0A8G7_9RHOB|nr:MerR family transcriptional regulator [Celeribacter marinus]ALI54244.1 transcriptional regulator, MerR family [Celeribacter marinus]SFK32822.1 MerR HTH family regulatory protein [Celeribacter marinus]
MQKSPDAFRTISEVADWLDTPAHVLRFWESRFTQIKPVKRAGGRRYYRPADMSLLGGIKKLLHDDGMTIRGVQKLLREHGVKHISAMSPEIEGYTPDAVDASESDVIAPAPMALDVPQAPENTETTPTVVPFSREGDPIPAQDASTTAPIESLLGAPMSVSDAQGETIGDDEDAPITDQSADMQAEAAADAIAPVDNQISLFDFDPVADDAEDEIALDSEPDPVLDPAPEVECDEIETPAVFEPMEAAPASTEDDTASEPRPSAPTYEPSHDPPIHEPLSAISAVLEKADPYRTDRADRSEPAIEPEAPTPLADFEPETDPIAPNDDAADATLVDAPDTFAPLYPVDVPSLIEPPIGLPDDPLDSEDLTSSAVHRSRAALGAVDRAVLASLLDRAQTLRARLDHAE